MFSDCCPLVDRIKRVCFRGAVPPLAIKEAELLDKLTLTEAEPLNKLTLTEAEPPNHPPKPSAVVKPSQHIVSVEVLSARGESILSSAIYLHGTGAWIVFTFSFTFTVSLLTG